MRKSLIIFLLALGACFSLTACDAFGMLSSTSESSSSSIEELSSESKDSDSESDSEEFTSGTNEEERQSVTITFKQDGQNDIVRTIEKGSSLINVPSPKGKIGYSVAWDKDNFTDVTEDMVVNAVEAANTYTVTYDANGGMVSAATQKVTFDAVTTLAQPTKEDYLFSGWKYEGALVEDNTAWKIAEDVTLVAEWTDNRPMCTVTFVDGDSQTEVSVKKGESVSTDSIPAFVGKTGYSAAWNITDYTNIVTNTVVTAIYTANTYTITYDVDGFSLDGKTVELTYDAACTALDMSLETESERLEGWKYGETVYTNESVWDVAESVTVEAVWTVKDEVKVSFVDTDGKTIEKTLYRGQILTEMPVPTEKIGYTVDSVWYTDESFTEVASFGKIETSFTVYAKAVANTYTVTYNANGGATTSKTLKVTYDASYTLETPTNEDKNMSFAGWVTDENETVGLTGTWNIAKDVTLTAKWADLRATYTVTFVQEGQPDKTYQVKGGEDLTEVPTPVSKVGYVVEWDVKNFKGISNDMTVTAIERAKTCTITLDAKGGSVESMTITLTYGQAYELPTPIHTMRGFEGWKLNGEEISMQGIWEMDIEGEFTFEAQWGAYEWTGSY